MNLDLLSPEMLDARNALSPEDQVLFDVLMDPAFAEWSTATDAEKVEEAWERYGDLEGFLGYDSYSDAAEVVARLIRCLDARLGEWGDRMVGSPSLSFTCDTDGVIGSYQVSVYLGHDLGVYLSASSDIKHLAFDREATGLAAAIGYATNFYGDYHRLFSKGVEAGLIPADVKALTALTATE